jgi:hypothetical protein
MVSENSYHPDHSGISGGNSWRVWFFQIDELSTTPGTSRTRSCQQWFFQIDECTTTPNKSRFSFD